MCYLGVALNLSPACTVFFISESQMIVQVKYVGIECGRCTRECIAIVVYVDS